MFKELIEAVYDLHIYYIFHLIDAICACIAVMFICNKKHLKLNKARAAVWFLLIYVALYAWMLFQAWAEQGFSYFGAQNAVRTFIWLPVFCWPICRLCRLDYKTMVDIGAPAIMVAHGVGHIACIFEGCCQGFPSQWGIWNAALQTTVFPVVILEIINALVIAIVLMIWFHRRHYQMPGTAYPIMLVWYGIMRFILEIFRDNAKIRWWISWLAVHAAIAVAVGVIWLIVYKKKTGHFVRPMNSN